jgi:mRNA interferase RelE/StbE
VSRYRLYISPNAFKEMRKLPGHMRQRVIRAVDELAMNPRPAKSAALDVSSIPMTLGIEPRRLRIDRWRIIYTVSEIDRTIDVLAVRKRPPYDYGDLAALLADYTP